MAEPGDPFNGRGILYFGNDWQAENRTSSHHVAIRLAQRTPVLYVSSPGMRKPRPRARPATPAPETAATLRRSTRVADNSGTARCRTSVPLWHDTMSLVRTLAVAGALTGRRISFVVPSGVSWSLGEPVRLLHVDCARIHVDSDRPTTRSVVARTSSSSPAGWSSAASSRVW
jgi:hypothetical protein